MSESENSKTYCRYCGKKADGWGKFCADCGKPIESIEDNIPIPGKSRIIPILIGLVAFLSICVFVLIIITYIAEQKNGAGSVSEAKAQSGEVIEKNTTDVTYSDPVSLKKKIEDKSGKKVVSSIDREDYEETFTFATVKGDEGIEIWFSDNTKCECITKTDIDGEAACSELSFTDDTHYCIRIIPADEDTEGMTYTFREEGGIVYPVYEGNACLIAEGENVYSHENVYEFVYDENTFEGSYEWVEKDQKIGFINGYYYILEENSSSDYFGTYVPFSTKLGNMEGIDSESCTDIDQLCADLFDRVLEYRFGGIKNSDPLIKYIYEDLDEDGKKEVLAYYYFGRLPVSGAFGFYYVDGKDVYMIEENPNDTIMYNHNLVLAEFSEATMCFVDGCAQVEPFCYAYQFFDSGYVIRNMCINKVEMIDDSVYCKNTYSVDYDPKTDHFFASYKSFAICQNLAKLDFVDNHFIEYASIGISEEDFRKYKGADKILMCIPDYLKEFFRDGDIKRIVKNPNTDDYDIENILLCSDGYIYINLSPRRHMKNYCQYFYDDGSMIDSAAMVIRAEYDGNTVSYKDWYWGYRDECLGGGTPYYGDISIDAGL
ncbi:MAG: hypothetical protein K5697_05770 [Lachnospiraceae bacterium]|nr:hypothetical protein [Lachnospiraceae bacterium]